jgi:hypothetical protein
MTGPRGGVPVPDASYPSGNSAADFKEEFTKQR